MSKILRSRWTKVVVFLLCLVPAAKLGWRMYSSLIPLPVEVVTHTTGDWTIWLLGITLAITPLRGLVNQPLLVRFRRMFGLFAFFYACLHFSVWIWLDHYFDWKLMWEDIVKRKYITLGMLGLVLMMPLALTSTAWAVRKMGFKRWQMLHRLVYLTALAGVIHYYWLVKSDVRWPLFYAAVFLLLMSYRAAVWWRARQERSRRLSTQQA